MNLAQLWDICISLMWDDTYINGLENFCRKRNINTILDCAGGTGFPTINLARRGWSITYVDASQEMVDGFQHNVQSEKLNIPFQRANWIELSDVITGRFDLVLCRGNSLVYVDSWGAHNISEKTLDHISRSMQNFYTVLNNGGWLYVDVISHKEFAKKSYPIIEDFGEKNINGKNVKLVWELNHDYERNMRTWRATVDIDGDQKEFVNYSYLLTHEMLRGMMTKAGFTNVEQVQINGESNYDVFVGQKVRKQMALSRP